MKVIELTDRQREVNRKEKIRDRVVAGVISGTISGIIISFFQLMLHYFAGK